MPISTGTWFVMMSNTGGAGARLLDDLAQLLRRRVALDGEGDANALVAVADLSREAEDAAQVHVAFDRGLDLGERHAARGGDVGDAADDAGAEAVEQVLDRRRRVVVADQDRRVIGVNREGPLVGVLAAGAAEGLDRPLAVRALQPAVRGAELELRERRVLLDDVDGGEQVRNVDAVERHTLALGRLHCGFCHDENSSFDLVNGNGGGKTPRAGVFVGLRRPAAACGEPFGQAPGYADGEERGL